MVPPFSASTGLAMLIVLPHSSQLAPCTVQSALYRADSQFERLGNFHFRKVIPITENDRRTVNFVEILQEDMKSVTLLMFDGFCFRVEGGGVSNLIGCAILVLLIHRKDGKFAAAEPINTIVGSDRKQPGSKRPALVIAMQILIGTQKRLLRSIFSHFRLTQHAITQVVDVRLMFLDELCKRFVIALLSLENPGKFVVHSRSLYLLYAGRRKKL